MMSNTKTPTEMSTEHDFTSPRWGYSADPFTFRDHGFRGQFIEFTGFGRGLKEGDFIRVPHGQSESRYKILSIKYMTDPSDQWFAETEFAPRQEKKTG